MLANIGLPLSLLKSVRLQNYAVGAWYNLAIGCFVWWPKLNKGSYPVLLVFSIATNCSPHRDFITISLQRQRRNFIEVVLFTAHHFPVYGKYCRYYISRDCFYKNNSCLQWAIIFNVNIDKLKQLHSFAINKNRLHQTSLEKYLKKYT